MEPPVESASAELNSKVGRAFKKVQGSFKIATEKAGRRQPKAVITSASVTLRWELS